jgi:eukaryotic-like serine/threonine-protein kinase
MVADGLTHAFVRTALIAFAVILAGGGAPYAAAQDQTPAATAPASQPAAWTADDWPSARGDLLNTGQSRSQTDAEKGTVKWQFIHSGRVTCTPVVAGGVVYVAGADSVIVALDAKSGKLIWQTEKRGVDQSYTYSVPCVAGDRIYASTHRGLVTAFSCKDGKALWQRQLPGEVYSSLRVAGGRVFAGCMDKFFYALDAENGSEVWKYECGDTVGSSCAISRSGKIIFPSHDKGLYVLDATTGKCIVRHDIGYRSTGSPAVVNGCAYYCMTGRKFACIDLLDGSMRWNQECLTDHQQGVGVWGQQVMVHIGRYLFAFDANNGKELWKSDLSQSGSIAPCVGRKLVYAADANGAVFAFDLVSGERKWKFTGNSGGWCAPVLVDGLVYFADANGFVYAIE